MINPLAVVTVPTVFVHDVEDPETSTERRFDIFTPLAELPFVDHPTIGTAVFLYPRGVRTLHAKAGRINIQQSPDGALQAAIPHNVRLHERRLPGFEKSSPVSRSQSQLETTFAEAKRGAPLFSIVKGMTFALIEISSLEVLGGRPEKVGGRSVHKIRTRMVNQIIEDPATGSAACALSSFSSLHVFQETSLTYEITQGVEMERESNMMIDVEVGKEADGIRKLESLHLGGKAVQVMSCFITSRP
ncbi:Diaminopimelate epimerase-like protein [Aspergillus affinis]|uniref:Diaminopimelate epimerase-like protein n=1 Tax=Aspergillus affinis TaxID=1070780 RepID=UPI0022FE0A54|nr:Diaminopimelate epimerase-like protein [Aspergillus affinis]KAI9035321.1 Diaminopimelate epimerase-like protein [Aspergillus affinis]